MRRCPAQRSTITTSTTSSSSGCAGGAAVCCSAVLVIFLHNHPSGDPTPSKEDMDITARLKDAGDILGIKVLDHIVIGDGKYVSFAEEHLM